MRRPGPLLAAVAGVLAVAAAACGSGASHTSATGRTRSTGTTGALIAPGSQGGPSSTATTGAPLGGGSSVTVASGGTPLSGRTGPAATSSTATTAAPGAPSGGSWLTYHGDQARSGVDASGAVLQPTRAKWTSPTLDGKVYAEPLVWGSLVVAATENDTIYGLDAASGAVRWSAHVGSPVPQSSLPCGDIDPLGITGTPAIDPSTGTIYAVAETVSGGSVSHRLVAVAANGKLAWSESADPSGMTPTTQQQRGGLTLANGRVYITYGGLYGDCGHYHGWVVSAPASGPGRLRAYQVPSGNEAGIWAPPGPSVDSAGNLYVATGNSSSQKGYDEGNSVLELSPGLSLLSSFAPSNWANLNANDSDLGSTSPQLLAGGLVFQAGKNQQGFLLRAGNLGGIGHPLFQASMCFTIGGEAYRAPDLYVACRSGIEDVRVTVSPPSFKVAWTGPGNATGPPVVAGGLVWSVGSGTLYGLNPSTGATVVQESLGSPAPYSTPGVGDGELVVGAGQVVKAFS
ncbi:MAG TPA: PQQ-binding-like beta-propeller repeat protein [Acidimicrobiales bacterium]|nr:PQQ-binding-like beta-propeller repeat protein [Acidimicrobiales bacterium]